MPIYEYTCSGCSKDFELLIRGTEVARCPTCGNSRIARQISVPAVHNSAGVQDLPICQADSGPPCGPDFCRTGQCDFN